jgi:3-oxoacyl-[acyl-carrier-protein] synthase II
MTEVFVSGMGWVTAAGFGAGRGGKTFSWGTGELPPIRRSQVFTDPHPHFGRLDRYSRLGIAAIAMALRDAGMERIDLRGRTAALIASTVHGCLETDVRFLDSARSKGKHDASPHLFAFTLSNTFLGEAAIEFGFTGATYLVNEAELTGSAALRMSVESIMEKESEIVATGLCDVGPPTLLMANNAPSGALFFVLSRALDTSRPYGRLAIRGNYLLFEGEPVNNMIELAKRLSGR